MTTSHGNRERITTAWWRALSRPDHAGELVIGEGRPGLVPFLFLFPALLYFIYGASMGLFQGWLPALVSGLKMPVLYLATLIVCFPPFYALNCIIGPRLSFTNCVRMLLLAVSANAVALASYAPISYFFTLTTADSGYVFLLLMHIGVLGVVGFASVIEIALIFRAATAAVGARYQPIMMFVWALLFGFVGTQLSWALRPWLGAPDVPFEILRPREGSFIEAVWHLVSQAVAT